MEEIAQTTYFWCYFCIEHQLYRFVAQNTTYWGNLLQLGLIRHFGWVDMISDKWVQFVSAPREKNIPHQHPTRTVQNLQIGTPEIILIVSGPTEMNYWQFFLFPHNMLAHKSMHQTCSPSTHRRYNDGHVPVIFTLHVSIPSWPTCNNIGLIGLTHAIRGPNHSPILLVTFHSKMRQWTDMYQSWSICTNNCYKGQMHQ